MKHYVFLTFAIQEIGGGQCYVAAKSEYLESKGWHVVIFSSGNRNGKKCPIDYLEKFKDYTAPEIGRPVFMIPSFLVNNQLKAMINHIGSISNSDEIIIESGDDKTALWGELLAERLGARHFIKLLPEHYRSKRQCFKNKLDFYRFKFERGELFGRKEILDRLFEDYMVVAQEDCRVAVINESPVRDEENKVVEQIQKKDYNICYIGRASKPYMENVILGVAAFAKHHVDKSVLFIMVGDFNIMRPVLNEVSRVENLIITETGPLHPLPKSLFKKTDVVIAGSGSARCSAEEGVLTIIAEPESKMSSGILGYETKESIYQSDDSVLSSFEDALERALVEQSWKGKPYKYVRQMSVEECVNQNFELMKNADQKMCYFNRKKLMEGRLNAKATLSLILRKLH